MAVIRMNVFSACLNMQTNVNVILPTKSFADAMTGTEHTYEKGMKYQTLWLLHGSTGDMDDYLNFSNILRYADEHKLAVVMPPAFHTGFQNLIGGERGFDFYTKELVELCRMLFPLSDKREDNFVAGLSGGSSAALRAAMVYPENYGAVLVMSGNGSMQKPLTDEEKKALEERQRKAAEERAARGEKEPTIMMGFVKPIDPVLYNTTAFAERNVKEGRTLPKVFMTCGTDDFIYGASEYCKDQYIKMGYDVTWEAVPGYGHEWDFWDIMLRKALNEWFDLKNSPIYPE